MLIQHEANAKRGGSCSLWGPYLTGRLGPGKPQNFMTHGISSKLTPFCVKNKIVATGQVKILSPQAVIDFSSIEATTKSPTGEIDPKSVIQTQKSMSTPANEIILSILVITF